MSKIRRTIRSSLWLVLIALAPAVLSWSRFDPAATEPLRSGEIAVDDERLVGANVLWIDARPHTDFMQSSVPQAISVSLEKWEVSLPDIFERWKPGSSIVVYCDEGCHSSTKVAERLRELGLEPVFVLKGGYQAWEKNLR